MRQISDLDFEREHLGHLVEGLNNVTNCKKWFVSIAIDHVIEIRSIRVRLEIDAPIKLDCALYHFWNFVTYFIM